MPYSPPSKREMGLAGRHVVVTRPAGQAAHLAAALSEAGAQPVLFPVLAIEAIADPTALLDIAIRLDQFDFAVFVSPNAVAYGLDTVLAHRGWPAGLRAVTVGRSSEQALAERGIRDVLVPEGRFDSEAVLDLPELQGMAGKSVVVFRGDGGRELLGETLARRGARVEYVACYRRSRPRADVAHLMRLWQDASLDAITITSSEGLRNLADMAGPLGLAFLKKTPLFVPHARIAEQARSLGCREVVLTGPADDGLMAGLQNYFGQRND